MRTNKQTLASNATSEELRKALEDGRNWRAEIQKKLTPELKASILAIEKKSFTALERYPRDLESLKNAVKEMRSKKFLRYLAFFAVSVGLYLELYPANNALVALIFLGMFAYNHLAQQLDRLEFSLHPNIANIREPFIGWPRKVLENSTDYFLKGKHLLEYDFKLGEDEDDDKIYFLYSLLLLWIFSHALQELSRDDLVDFRTAYSVPTDIQKFVGDPMYSGWYDHNPSDFVQAE